MRRVGAAGTATPCPSPVLHPAGPAPPPSPPQPARLPRRLGGSKRAAGLAGRGSKGRRETGSCASVFGLAATAPPTPFPGRGGYCLRDGRPTGRHALAGPGRRTAHSGADFPRGGRRQCPRPVLPPRGDVLPAAGSPQAVERPSTWTGPHQGGVEPGKGGAIPDPAAGGCGASTAPACGCAAAAAPVFPPALPSVPSDGGGAGCAGPPAVVTPPPPPERTHGAAVWGGGSCGEAVAVWAAAGWC